MNRIVKTIFAASVFVVIVSANAVSANIDTTYTNTPIQIQNENYVQKDTVANTKVRFRDRPSYSEFSRTAAKLSVGVVVGIVNPAVEFKVLRNATVQLEALGIFANTNFLGTGKPLELGAGFGEFRYYIKRAFDGFYFGPTIGYGVYKLNKSLVLRYTHQYLDGSYQQGTNIMCGLTIGYAYNVNKHWSIEASWSGGFQGSAYEGYAPNPNYNEATDVDKYIMYTTNNGSAEWPPMFKCGLFVVYRW